MGLEDGLDFVGTRLAGETGNDDDDKASQNKNLNKADEGIKFVDGGTHPQRGSQEMVEEEIHA